jgi:mono/diheme cytochrome c family protein
MPYTAGIVPLVLALWGVTLGLPNATAQEQAIRVDHGLLALYDFSETSGQTIHDRANAGDPLDLEIEKHNGVRWFQGTLVIDTSASIRSRQPARKIIDAVKKSQSLTIEGWVKPANNSQSGPARIVSLSSDTSNRNFTLGQDHDLFDVRLRATSSDSNGLPSLSSPQHSLQTQLTHVVFTHDSSGVAVLFIDGKQVAEKKVLGDFSNWDPNHRLVLANELTGDRPWLGELHLVAIFDRALSAEEVQQNYACGARTVEEAMNAELADAFRNEIQPLLRDHCVKCHGPEKQKGNLRLDMKQTAFKRGDSGERAIVPGHAMESRLFQMVSSQDEAERMPPEGDPLTESQIALLKAWINQGATWPDADSETVKTAQSRMVVTDEDRNHWSFRPLQEVVPPTVQDQAWIQTPVDLFIRQAQAAQDLSPAAQAHTRLLVRRMYFDLIGLPPRITISDGKMNEELLGIEIDAASLPTLVDRLLDSPHYGERWARHWLDVARYADSNGQEGDADRPTAYRFRDFVIRSLNEDLPYDEFVRWQLAGDEIAPDNPQAIAATGFIVAGNSTVLNVPMEEEKLRNRANELDDMVSTTAQAFLGLTLACSRCHDHKYDPLPTLDYYRMMSAFNSGDRRDVALADPATVQANRAATEAWQRALNAAEKTRDDWLKNARKGIESQVRNEKISKLAIDDNAKQLLLNKPDDPEAKKLADRYKKELKVKDDEYVAALAPQEQNRWQELVADIKKINAQKPATLPTAFAFADDAPEARETWLFERGDFLARNERVSLGFLTVLTNGKSAEDYWNEAREAKLRSDSTQQRRAMALWMTDVERGAGALLARVIVNRIWQHHFGEGLVRTVSDFGTRGERPSHPELLEWLAGELIHNNWSLKHIQRLIVNSATFQQSVTFDAAKSAIDPENRLLWRRTPQRLESEALRDAMLAVAGSLNTEMYGPSFKPPIPSEAMQARNVKDPYPRDLQENPGTCRRSVYMFHKRVVQYPLMLAFDAPDAQVSCGRRLNTTVAPQALALLNDPFVRRRAEELAKRLQTEAGHEIDAQIALAFQLALARQPTDVELMDTKTFVNEQTSARSQRDANLNLDTARRLALTDFCQMLFALNEFIYVD